MPDAAPNVRAMILCAGYGTRLRPLTDEVPKPLVPVGDRTLLEHIAGRLAAAGFGAAVVNTHHLPSVFQSCLDGLRIDLHFIHEPEIRGTAGGVSGAASVLGGGPVLVWNGDILADPPLAALLRRARAGGACLAVAPRSPGEGTVGLDAEGNVVRLRDETFGDEASGADYVGIAALGADALASLPARGCLVGDCYLPRLRRGSRLEALTLETPWREAGDVSAYLDLNLEWLDRRRDGRSWVGPGAAIESGVILDRCVVGSGARVSGAGSLVECVVWPGASIAAPARRIIVTTGGRIVPA